MKQKIPYNQLIRRLSEHAKVKGVMSWIMRHSVLSYTTFYKHINHQFFCATPATHTLLEQLLEQLDRGVDLTPPVSTTLIDSTIVRNALRTCSLNDIKKLSEKTGISYASLIGYRARKSKMCNKKIAMNILKALKIKL